MSLSFISAAKPSDLGTFGIVLVLVLVVGGTTFGTYPCEVFQKCVQKLPDFLHISGNVISKVIKSFFLNYDWNQRRRSVKGSLSCSFPLYFTLRRLCQRAPKTRKTN